MSNRPWIVLKFGGTSVAAPAGWQQIARRINQLADDHQLLIVVSAASGVTDLLHAACIAQGGKRTALLAQVAQRYQALIADLGIERTAPAAQLLSSLSETADAALSAQAQAQLLAKGEQIMSAIGAGYLREQGLDVVNQDAGELLTCEPAFDGHTDYLAARCDAQAEPELQRRLAAQSHIHITQGFLCRDRTGALCLLGRGGSDTSAAYLAVTLQAKSLEIWTDVPGLFSADPRLISGARLLRSLSYREAQELASMGAKVLHPRCIAPVREAQIPLLIKQTSRPDIAGTSISNAATEADAQVKAVVQRKGITLVAMEGIDMWHQVGFLARCFDVFAQLGLSIDLISTSEANVTVSLDLASQAIERERLSALSERLAEICSVRIIEDCASVSLVGLNIRTIMHRLGPALEVFEQRKIHLVSQAANDLNLSFVVDSQHADRLVMQLHQQLIPGGVGGDSVFGQTWSQLFRREREAVARTPWWRAHRETLTQTFGDRQSAFAYHRQTFAQQAQSLTELRSIDHVLYAMKANAHPALLACARDHGLGFECVSPTEVARALETAPDLDRRRILFTPNFAAEAEYCWALKQGVQLTVDNPFVIENWGENLRGASVFLRIDPGSGLGHHKLVRTAGTFSKFGIPLSQFDQVLAQCRDFDITVRGLHAHTGSGIMHADNWARTLSVLRELQPRLPDLAVIDLGGGLGVPDRDVELPFDLAALDEQLGSLKQQLPDHVELWLEPGRYLVAECGVLLARATQRKGKGDVQYLGVTTGMNSLIRPALYGAYHDIVNLSRLDEPTDQIYNVVGPICETGDVLGLDRLLPRTEPGDIILIANTGAYGAVMASDYNLRPAAEELII